MKMEVLSVQNQLQGQFGVIGSSKVKDWASPLTAPPPPPTHPQTQQRNRPPPQRGNNTQRGSDNGDVVDGPAHAHTPHLLPFSKQPKAMEAATAAAEATNRSRSLPRYTYNNNLLYCGERAAEVARAALHEQLGRRFSSSPEEDIEASAVHELSQRLQAELRAAKRRHLACTEVSLPWDLTPRIAAEIIRSSEQEPCGVRGCSIYIEFEDEPNNSRRIASFKVDPYTVSTFEMYLTLKHDRSGWTSLLPQFLKNLTRSSTILISPDFSLTKNKLYSGE